MATTFKVRIEDLIGPVGDNDLISDSLENIGAQIMSVAPVDKLNNISLEVTIPDGADESTASIGIDIADRKVLGASKGGYRARAINSEEKTRYLDSDSIYRASDTTPVFYIKDEKAFLIASDGLETGGTLRYVLKKPTLTWNSNSISGFPREAISLLMIGAASRCLQRILTDKSNSLPNNIVSPVLRGISTALPSYVSPSALVLTPPPAGADVDFSSVPSAPAYIKPVLSLTTLTEPDDLVISTSLPTVPILNDINVSFTATPPSYIKPVVTIGSFPTVAWAFPDQPIIPVLANTDVSFTQDVPTYTKPVLAVTTPVTLSSFPLTDSSDWIMPVKPEVPTTSAKTVGTFQNPPTFTPPVMQSLDFGGSSGTEFWITTEEDSEMLSARIQEISSKIQEYQARLTEAQAIFSKENAIFQADIQKRVQEAQLADTDEGRKIQKYQSELQSYQSEVNTMITKNQGRISAWQAEMSLDLEKFNADSGINLQTFQADMQNELNVFNKESAVYQAELQVSIQNAQFDNETEASKLQIFSADLQRYQAKVQEIVTGNQAEIASWESEQGLKLQKNQSDMQNALNEFNKETAVYQAELQISIQNAQLSSGTEANKLQSFASELQRYQADVNQQVEKYTINEVQKQIGVWTSRVQNELAEYSANIQNESTRVGNDMGIYQQEIQKALQKYQSETGYDLQKYQAVVAADVQKFQMDLQDNTSDFTNSLTKYSTELSEITQSNQSVLALYGSDVQNYSAKMQKEITDYQWKQGQYAALYQDYMQGLQMFSGSSDNVGNPEQLTRR